MRPRIIPRPEHPVSRRSIDSDALKVLYRLYRAGHTAYLVGGGVRDLLLGRRPKDFDVGTSARPCQIRRLFRNCRLIGRRFRLAHIHFAGGKIVEVSTFRRDPDPDEEVEGAPGLQSLRDNTFGTPEEDARRRDFTVNGLFYDISNFAIIDYVGGVKDLRRRLLRTIGDPWERFREDPVRMIRAVKFCARLGFQMDRKVWKALQGTRREVAQASVPRVQEELTRLLESGSAARSFDLLHRSGLLEVLLPEMAEAFRREEASGVEGSLHLRFLKAIDAMVAEGRTPSRPLLYAAVLLPTAGHAGFAESARPDKVVRDAMAPLVSGLGISRRDAERVQQMVLAQRKLRPRRRGFAPSLASKSYFPAALELLELTVRATGEGRQELERWREHTRERRRHDQAVSEDRQPPRRKRRRRRKRTRPRSRRAAAHPRG